MRAGRKPNRKEKGLLDKRRLNSDNWLVVKNLPRELLLIHRHTGNERVVPK